jgi:hypothetical protein
MLPLESAQIADGFVPVVYVTNIGVGAGGGVGGVGSGNGPLPFEQLAITNTINVVIKNNIMIFIVVLFGTEDIIVFIIIFNEYRVLYLKFVFIANTSI